MIETWRCHVCQDLRPDDDVAVCSEVGETATGLTIRVNVTFCRDREQCRTQAPALAKSWLKDFVA